MRFGRSAGAAWWNRRHPEESIPFDEISVQRAPRYLLDRAAVAVDRRRTADTPWITQAAIGLLDSLLRPTDVGLEYGSGGSTIWLARRTKVLTTVEAFPQWHQAVQARIAEQGLQNVDLELVTGEDGRLGTPEHREAYVYARPGLEPESLDYVLVDGEYRDHAALRAVELLRAGGILVLDNANHYLPHPSRTPLHVSSPRTDEWRSLLDRVHGWRLVWTTNGVWDTAVWIKTGSS
jgi:predicted O-methyltransferase YrrM